MALDNEISEFDFWNMTLAELERAILSKQRIRKSKEQERASFDYMLANLIGRSVGRLYSSDNKFPTIEEAYPTLFEVDEEKQQEKQDDVSAIRFKQFADSFNAKFQKEGSEHN